MMRFLILITATLAFLTIACKDAPAGTTPAPTAVAAPPSGGTQQPPAQPPSGGGQNTTPPAGSSTQPPSGGSSTTGTGTIPGDLTVGSPEFCQAMAQAIGAPANKWSQTFNAQGRPISNSCTLRDADSRDPLGWELMIPQGVVAHIWLDRQGQKTAVTAVGPGPIRQPYLGSRATFYFNTGVDFGGHRGQWTPGIWSGADSPTSGWTNIGSAIAGGGASQGGTASTSNPGCTLDKIKQATGVSGGTWTQATSNGWHYEGPSATFRADGLVIDHPGAGGRATSGMVTANVVTVYCP